MSEGTPRSYRGLLRDPVLLALAGVTLLGWVHFALLDDSVRRIQVYWAAQVPLDAMLAVGGWRLRGIAAQRYRRFWSSIAFAGACFTAGDSFQFLSTLFGPPPDSMSGGAVQSVLFTVGMCSNVLACLIFPQGLNTGREKLVFWLDAATVLVGGGVMAWCFAVNPIDEQTDQVTASITAALVIVAAFSATKVALIPRPPMARIAAWPMVAAPMVQGVSTFLPGAFQTDDQWYVFAVRLLPSLLIAVGPRIQELTVRIDGSDAVRKRRPYSLLPYVMIGLTFVVFFAVLPAHLSTQFWGATVGVVVITVLVAGRQLVAFQDNVGLIRQLDVALGDLREQEVQLREQAATDALTRLANRDRFNAELDLLRDEEHTVLLIDLDDFKTVNDTMGHAAGDALLVAVAARLRTTVRSSDLVARLGGDEFAIVMPRTGAEDAGHVATNLLLALAQPIPVQQHSLVARASIGVAAARRGSEPSVLLSNADIAMYEAKRRGKSTWVVYTDRMGARIGAEAELVRDLSQALEAGQFSLVYQPIVRLSDRTLTGVESLIRWHHPVRGAVAPADFIPLAERSGQIVAIGSWALREACRQAAAWRRCHPEAASLTIGVNVAGRQLRTGTFPEEVARVLAETGLPAERLSIEVTETAVLDDEESHEALQRLRDLGVRLALDDFGTAASSLGLLLTCPVTTLKLDRSFVESITTVSKQAAVATAVSQMAHALGFSSVAEGIETAEQLALLEELGYQYGQGYLFSRPLTPADLVAQWGVTLVPLSAAPARLGSDT
ncbi:putative bifunctional diguanylate cyclase/phosphodiesterase [Symbioplanes lichenis]|uniref:putative bifunctional diguanylate cyclase/phosphodiesterase n=1 Tax=Symbioplanes lichenis TaxID=1629072 RepID=UPI0027395C7F|nr:bifunctional diguanylate cyclase/phosphodiesterase [Actinoplanes lichenis]